MIKKKKKDYCGCVCPKSYDFIHLWFKQKGLRYLDLIFDFFERLILPSILRKKNFHLESR